ncbi:hypothetical protein SAMN05518672_10186 [Chitinophaga sp. CF118]|nr:hypothetical protein SAMN05518672_10186 [Chitinophaga sp. CF118]
MKILSRSAINQFTLCYSDVTDALVNWVRFIGTHAQYDELNLDSL